IESITKFIPRRRIKIYAMAEIPSNIIVAQAFLKIFDGFSIGSNDLTQLVFGLDRDNQSLAGIANENQKAMRLFLADLIKTAKRLKKYIGICGQAPSDYLDFALFLVKNGIDSISLNPDSVVKTLLAVAKLEKSVRNQR
ncbi:phosphoenolpyruvate synthase, partial [Patescibacteria group bacterium]|nr:phosphoenolpyruvate synthase [Patescibacteria group bacterium]